MVEAGKEEEDLVVGDMAGEQAEDSTVAVAVVGEAGCMAEVPVLGAVDSRAEEAGSRAEGQGNMADHTDSKKHFWNQMVELGARKPN